MVVNRRKGFTVLELLVVIGVLALLGTITVIGLKYVMNPTAEKAAKVAFENLRSMRNELKLNGGLTNMPGAAAAPATNPGSGLVYDSATRLSDPWILFTQKATGLMATVPANAAAFQNMSSKGLLCQNVAGKKPEPVVPFVFVDGWNNPIIYVPASGLPGVTMPDPATVGARFPAATITSPDGQPFWASAGADGNFSTGEDNLYSFNP